MAMPFSFGFSSDDIEEDEKPHQEDTLTATKLDSKDEHEHELIPPKLHTLEEMVGESRICTLLIRSYSQENKNSRKKEHLYIRNSNKL
jgi:hypothetical protein